MEDNLSLSFKLKNIGNISGAEVVQFYVKDLKSSIIRPEKELKRFKKVNLNTGEEKTVSFPINETDLRFTAADMKFKSKPGMVKVFMGSNSVDVLESKFELVE